MTSNYLPTPYQEFIHLSRYSRWLPDKGRRETWDETVARYFDFFKDHLKELLDTKIASTRNGGDGTGYLAGVGGTNSPSSFRPLDFDLEGKPLYPNYNNNSLNCSL